jgi:small subunit ribosomal protein S7
MRKRRAPKRVVLPDPKYKSVLVNKFINKLMIHGKKAVAEKIFYESMDLIAAKLKTDKPLDVFKKAVQNTQPMLEVRSRRVGGATYQVPVEVREVRRESLAIRWLVGFTKKRNEKTMAERLAFELIAANGNEGATIKKREETHKMAEANKAFAHFKW